MANPQARGLPKSAMFVWHSSSNAYQAWDGINAGQLVPKEYDAIHIQYITGGSINTVAYYTGGTGGTNVATLALTYSDGLITTVSRS